MELASLKSAFSNTTPFTPQTRVLGATKFTMGPHITTSESLREVRRASMWQPHSCEPFMDSELSDCVLYEISGMKPAYMHHSSYVLHLEMRISPAPWFRS
jgi:hypothetical protein